MCLFAKAQPIFRALDAVANGVGGICRFLRSVKYSGYSAVATCLTMVTGQGRVVSGPENTRTKRARKYHLDKVRLARVDASKHSIEVLKEEFVWS